MDTEYTAPAPTEEDDTGMEVDTPQSEDSDNKTALVPTDFFQGKDLTPGTTCSVKIERVLDGQVEVSYVPHAEEESMEGESGDQEMASYMNE